MCNNFLQTLLKFWTYIGKAKNVLFGGLCLPLYDQCHLLSIQILACSLHTEEQGH